MLFIILLIISGVCFPVSESDWYEMSDHKNFSSAQKVMAIDRAIKLKCIDISEILDVPVLVMTNPTIKFWEESWSGDLCDIQKESVAIYEQLGLIQKELQKRKNKASNRVNLTKEESLDSSIFKIKCEQE
jgi:hypothetical protein